MGWLAVFVLGGLGALCRVGLVTLLPQRALPWGTLAVNLAGCLAIGLVFELFESGTEVAPELRVGLIGGFLGGFTTFSAFGLETWGLVTEGTPGLAAVYVASSLILGFLGVGLGIWTARALT